MENLCQSSEVLDENVGKLTGLHFLGALHLAGETVGDGFLADGYAPPTLR